MNPKEGKIEKQFKFIKNIRKISNLKVIIAKETLI